IEGTSSSALNGAAAIFQRTSGSDTAEIDISSFSITDHGNGNLTATATYQLPEDLWNASYSLTAVTIADQAGGYSSISNVEMNLGSRVGGGRKEAGDSTAPKPITKNKDKGGYAPGETVTVTVEGGGESEIDQMWGAFSDADGDSDKGTYRLDNIYITQNPLGN